MIRITQSVLQDFIIRKHWLKKLKAIALTLSLLLVFAGNEAWGQFVSNPVTGNYEDASSWNGTQPGVNGNDWRTLTIVDGAVITKAGNFTGEAAVTVDGIFNVNGNFTSGYGATTVNGDLNVSGAFNGDLIVGEGAAVNLGSVTSGSITVKNGSSLNVSGSYNGNLIVDTGGTVRVKNFTGGTFDVKSGGTLIIEDGDCTLTNNSHIRDQGRVEVFGDFYLESSINIEFVGILIIHGSFNAVGNWGMNISGNIVVKGDFSVTNGTILNDGNIVIGGDFTHTGGSFGGTNNENFYIINPDAEINAPGSTTVGQGNYGDLDDFLENESDNDDLMDIVQEIIPDLFDPTVPIIAEITSDSHTICQGDSYNLAITLTGNSPWDIKYSDGSTISDWITINTSPHTIPLTPTATSIYTVTEVRSDGKAGTITGDPVVVTVVVGSTAELTGLVTQSTICEGKPITLSLEITAPTPFELTITENSSVSSRSFNLTHEDLYFAGGNTYHFNVVEPPAWIDQGNSMLGLAEFTYSLTDFSDESVCPTTFSGDTSVNIFKTPETGPPYHIPNTQTP